MTSSTEPHSVVPDPRVRAVLDRLHAAAEAEMEAFTQEPRPEPPPEPGPFNAEGAVEFFADKYISLEREQGNLLYLLARSLGHGGRRSSAPRSGSRRSTWRRRSGRTAAGSSSAARSSRRRRRWRGRTWRKRGWRSSRRYGSGTRARRWRTRAAARPRAHRRVPEPEPDDAAAPRAPRARGRHGDGGQRGVVPVRDAALRGLGAGPGQRLRLGDAAPCGAAPSSPCGWRRPFPIERRPHAFLRWRARFRPDAGRPPAEDTSRDIRPHRGSRPREALRRLRRGRRHLVRHPRRGVLRQCSARTGRARRPRSG